MTALLYNAARGEVTEMKRFFDRAPPGCAAGCKGLPDRVRLLRCPLGLPEFEDLGPPIAHGRFHRPIGAVNRMDFGCPLGSQPSAV
jgi:hypothetical protein